MTTDNQKPKLSEALQEMRDKVSQARRAVEDMEKAKLDRVHFIERLNDFLSAIGNAVNIIQTQGKGYARQVKKGQQFLSWYEQKENLFRTPYKGKKGTDPTWVFLEAARDVTTHQQQVKPQDAYRTAKDIQGLFKLRVEGEPEPTLPATSDLIKEAVRNDEKIYLFKPLVVKNRRKKNVTLPPPNDDVLAVCKNHITTLEAFIDECKTVLE